MMGLKTIRQGQRAAVWDRHGRVCHVDGPRLLFLIGQAVQMLELHSAGPGQYLAISFTDGHREHIGGPSAVFFDPLRHRKIEIREAISLDANESIVVYLRAGDAVRRRIVRGPALFVPTADEWLHEFQWHGADPDDTRRKIPGALRFTKLRVIPDQTYFDVQDVRTADDALLVVKLMIFFELADIEKMLDQTHDPVADFINAVSADVIDFVASLAFDQFKEQTEKLNDLESYPQLVGRAQRIGYRINKVVYRGYHATNKLQAMHDDAIEKRTHLRLQAETETQAQELADLKLEREAERSVKRREMEASDAEHANRMKKLAHDESLRQLLAEHQQELENDKQKNEMILQHKEAVHHEQAAYLKEIRNLQVDLTRYLVARYQNPDRLIRIDGSQTAQLHLHEDTQ